MGPYFLLAIICAMMAMLYTRTQQGAIGSGGSGGVFGPAMVRGGCTGGAVGTLFHQVWPALVPHPASFVIMGMAGFFAAAAKTPFSTLIIVSEMTGDYRLFLPALWVCAWSFLLSDRQSLYRSQVESRSRSPDHQGDYVRDVLVGQYVRQFLSPNKEVPTLRPGDSLDIVLRRLDVTGYTVLPPRRATLGRREVTSMPPTAERSWGSATLWGRNS